MTESRKERTPEDRRAHNAWGLWVTLTKELHPDFTPSDWTISAFIAGWQARLTSSVDLMTEDARGSDDFLDAKVIEDEFRFLRREYDRAWTEYFKAVKQGRYYRKLWESARLMLSEAKLNPADAPIWKRVSNQRKELKALNKTLTFRDGTITMLQAEVARLREATPPVPSEDSLGRIIWNASKNDEGSISITGAQVVARAVRAYLGGADD